MKQISMTEYAEKHGVSRQRVWLLIKDKRIKAKRKYVGSFSFYLIDENYPWPPEVKK